MVRYTQHILSNITIGPTLYEAKLYHKLSFYLSRLNRGKSESLKAIPCTACEKLHDTACGTWLMIYILWRTTSCAIAQDTLFLPLDDTLEEGRHIDLPPDTGMSAGRRGNPNRRTSTAGGVSFGEDSYGYFSNGNNNNVNNVSAVNNNSARDGERTAWGSGGGREISRPPMFLMEQDYGNSFKMSTCAVDQVGSGMRKIPNSLLYGMGNEMARLYDVCRLLSVSWYPWYCMPSCRSATPRTDKTAHDGDWSDEFLLHCWYSTRSASHPKQLGYASSSMDARMCACSPDVCMDVVKY